MKKLGLFFLFTILLLLGAISCSSDDSDDITGVTVYSSYSAFDTDKLRILSMGLDTTDIIDAGEYYVVEEDILINKDSLNKYQATRQYHATYTVATGQTITIGVNSLDLLNNWGTELTKVADIYTEYTGNVFKFIGCDTDADIVISKESLPYSIVCAEGEFPVNNSGKPGKRVRINSTFYKDIDTFLSREEKVFLMMHEIGHNLGLRHTNCAVNGEGDAGIGMVKIPGTPDTDSNSYMNSATCGYSWKGMPEYDAVALKYLFPVVYNTIHFENCTGISDIKFKKGTVYKLSRNLFPSKDGYVFAGWYYGVGNPYIPAIDYGKEITGDLTLYARWKTRDNLKKINCVTYNGVKTCTFELTSTALVTFTSQVNKALNTWSELRVHEGTYSNLMKIDGSDSFSITIDMRGTCEMDVINNPPYAKSYRYFVLDPGTYLLTSSLTTELGEQDWGVGKHGSVESTISYY